MGSGIEEHLNKEVACHLESEAYDVAGTCERFWQVVA
jgi:hypothetical protein